jgi:RNA polymerase sigma factor (sigma-70 family)
MKPLPPPISTGVSDPSPEPLDTWFKREILSHEEILARFIARMWPRRHEIADIRQEAYIRVYEAARVARPLAPKAFLFTTARHLMADRVRRERIVSNRAGGDNEFLNVIIEELSPERRVSAHQELARLARAFDRLPSQCRDVIWLRRVKELSQKEVAGRMGLSEKTIEKHLRTAARLLARYTHDNALEPRANDTEVSDEAVSEHGSQQRR